MSKQDEKSTAVEPQPDHMIELWKLLESMLQTPEQVQASILARVDSAENVDQLFGETKTVSSDDYVGVPFIPRGTFNIHESGYKNTPYFMSIDAADPVTGQLFVINTSSPMTAKKMVQAAVKKMFNGPPFLLKFKRSEKATAAGYYPLDLIRATEEDFNKYKVEVDKKGSAVENTPEANTVANVPSDENPF